MFPIPVFGIEFFEDAMAYKQKPNKSVLKRFKLTKTGKIKCRHAKTSHLMSGRNGALKRRLGRAAIMTEGMARNMRRLMCASGTRPCQIAHERKLAAQEQAADQSAAVE